jgi:hypothetical protein
MSMYNRPHYNIGVRINTEISFLATTATGGNYLTNFKTMAERYPSRKAAITAFKNFCETRDVKVDFYSRFIVIGRNVLCD